MQNKSISCTRESSRKNEFIFLLPITVFITSAFCISKPGSITFFYDKNINGSLNKLLINKYYFYKKSFVAMFTGIEYKQAVAAKQGFLPGS
jgi:hypothetical protein